MYALKSGNTVIDDQSPDKDHAINRATEIVLGQNTGSNNRSPRSLKIVGIRGNAKRARPVEVVALGHRRQSVAVRQAG